jgi:REP element-mobilizing transposase RayT
MQYFRRHQRSGHLFQGRYKAFRGAYCLMDNHVHLAIETGKTPLPRIMAGLQSSYRQYFNRRHRRSGHLFQGRYKALLARARGFSRGSRGGRDLSLS